MAFDLDLLPFEDLHAEIVEGVGRVYSTPDGSKYPSVTTVLGANDDGGLEAWRQRVGREEADRISRIAAERGTLIHDSMESYILGKEPPNVKVMPQERVHIKNLCRLLDENLTKVYAVEAPLYSHNMKIAGRVDLIGEWKGKVSVIDFKTSRKSKKRDWITNYFIQETAYAIMAKERMGINVNDIVTLIANDNGAPQVFEERTATWIPHLLDTLMRFRKTSWKCSQEV